MGKDNHFLVRTVECAKLTQKDIGKEVIINGWANKRRDHGGLIFIDLRDVSGIVQTVIAPDNKEVFPLAQKVRSEFCLAIKGSVRKRPTGTENKNLKTGEIEIEVKELETLSKSDALPFEIADERIDEKLRLKYRYLDLRRHSMAYNLKLRHQVSQTVRHFLTGHGFLEVETPYLTKSTPEGARDFLVPSRLQAGHFYALPQSPQLFKQILMVAGVERYFQLARAFRDEDFRADRQPEHTQIDLEMSFITQEQIIKLAEEMVAKIFKLVEVEAKFERLNYDDVMDKYGTDKPDVRFDMEINDISQIVKESEFKVFKETVKKENFVKGIKVEGKADLSRSELDKLVEKAKELGAMGLVWLAVENGGFKSPVAKFICVKERKAIIEQFAAKPGDLLLVIADRLKIVNNVLSNLRNRLAKKFGLVKEGFRFLTITDFPMFEYDEEEKRLKSHHHPFTRPNDASVALLDKDPLKAKAYAYDMIINGVEIGGGSLRIYDSNLQEKIFSLLGLSAKESKDKFGFLLEAFKYGPPPHGGIAFGLDRLVMIMAQRETIRDVIAFPKTQTGADLMTGAPDTVSPKQLKDLNLKVEE